jgi:ethanolamine-phosphate cytidylyltransferase
MFCIFFSKFEFRYVSEVVIGAPYGIDKHLMNHFNVDLVCQGDTEVYLDENERDPYEFPKEVNKYKVISSGSIMNTDSIIDRIIANR